MGSRRFLFVMVLGVIVLAVAGIAWFEPHKLFVDDKVDEAAPTASSTATIAAGAFRSLEHASTGTATVLAVGAAERTLRFSGFETSNGPDLRVYLSTAPADADHKAFDDEFVDLGALKGNIGDQNYDIPPGTDLSRFRTAVVWCRRFTVPFAAADLKAS